MEEAIKNLKLGKAAEIDNIIFIIFIGVKPSFGYIDLLCIGEMLRI